MWQSYGSGLTQGKQNKTKYMQHKQNIVSSDMRADPKLEEQRFLFPCNCYLVSSSKQGIKL